MKCTRYILFGLLVFTFAAPGVALAVSSDEATKQITAAYEEIFGRKPDPQGMRIYRSRMVDDGWSIDDVRNELMNSEEAKNKNAEKIVRNAYQDILGRNPDPAGMKLYRGKILNEGWTEKKLRQVLRESAEAKR